MQNQTKIKLTLSAVALLILGAGPDNGDTALKRALDTALDDERHAIAFYDAVMQEHGQRRPFANIINAERRHAAALLAQYERLGLKAPPDRWAEHAFEIPETFREACAASAEAEVANVEMYDALIESADDERVEAVFERLRWAPAERHLPAFLRCSGEGSERRRGKGRRNRGGQRTP